MKAPLLFTQLLRNTAMLATFCLFLSGTTATIAQTTANPNLRGSAKKLVVKDWHSSNPVLNNTYTDDQKWEQEYEEREIRVLTWVLQKALKDSVFDEQKFKEAGGWPHDVIDDIPIYQITNSIEGAQAIGADKIWEPTYNFNGSKFKGDVIVYEGDNKRAFHEHTAFNTSYGDGSQLLKSRIRYLNEKKAPNRELIIYKAVAAAFGEGTLIGGTALLWYEYDKASDAAAVLKKELDKCEENSSNPEKDCAVLKKDYATAQSHAENFLIGAKAGSAVTTAATIILIGVVIKNYVWYKSDAAEGAAGSNNIDSHLTMSFGNIMGYGGNDKPGMLGIAPGLPQAYVRSRELPLNKELTIISNQVGKGGRFWTNLKDQDTIKMTVNSAGTKIKKKIEWLWRGGDVETKPQKHSKLKFETNEMQKQEILDNQIFKNPMVFYCASFGNDRSRPDWNKKLCYLDYWPLKAVLVDSTTIEPQVPDYGHSYKSNKNAILTGAYVSIKDNAGAYVSKKDNVAQYIYMETSYTSFGPSFKGGRIVPHLGVSVANYTYIAENTLKEEIYTSASYDIKESGNKDFTEPYGGTSSANPTLAGATVLLAEAMQSTNKITVDAPLLKALLLIGAHGDGVFSSNHYPVPNMMFGYGILDIKRSIDIGLTALNKSKEEFKVSNPYFKAQILSHPKGGKETPKFAPKKKKSYTLEFSPDLIAADSKEKEKEIHIRVLLTWFDNGNIDSLNNNLDMKLVRTYVDEHGNPQTEEIKTTVLIGDIVKGYNAMDGIDTENNTELINKEKITIAAGETIGDFELSIEHNKGSDSVPFALVYTTDGIIKGKKAPIQNPPKVTIKIEEKEYIKIEDEDEDDFDDIDDIKKKVNKKRSIEVNSNLMGRNLTIEALYYPDGDYGSTNFKTLLPMNVLREAQKTFTVYVPKATALQSLLAVNVYQDGHLIKTETQLIDNAADFLGLKKNEKGNTFFELNQLPTDSFFEVTEKDNDQPNIKNFIAKEPALYLLPKELQDNPCLYTLKIGDCPINLDAMVVHSAILTNTDSNIPTPEEMKGKKPHQIAYLPDNESSFTLTTAWAGPYKNMSVSLIIANQTVIGTATGDGKYLFKLKLPKISEGIPGTLKFSVGCTDAENDVETYEESYEFFSSVAAASIILKNCPDMYTITPPQGCSVRINGNVIKPSVPVKISTLPPTIAIYDDATRKVVAKQTLYDYIPKENASDKSFEFELDWKIPDMKTVLSSIIFISTNSKIRKKLLPSRRNLSSDSISNSYSLPEDISSFGEIHQYEPLLESKDASGNTCEVRLITEKAGPALTQQNPNLRYDAVNKKLILSLNITNQTKNSITFTPTLKLKNSSTIPIPIPIPFTPTLKPDSELTFAFTKEETLSGNVSKNYNYNYTQTLTPEQEIALMAFLLPNPDIEQQSITPYELTLEYPPVQPSYEEVYFDNGVRTFAESFHLVPINKPLRVSYETFSCNLSTIKNMRFVFTNQNNLRDYSSPGEISNMTLNIIKNGRRLDGVQTPFIAQSLPIVLNNTNDGKQSGWVDISTDHAVNAVGLLNYTLNGIIYQEVIDLTGERQSGPPPPTKVGQSGPPPPPPSIIITKEKRNEGYFLILNNPNSFGDLDIKCKGTSKGVYGDQERTFAWDKEKKKLEVEIFGPDSYSITASLSEACTTLLAAVEVTDAIGLKLDLDQLMLSPKKDSKIVTYRYVMTNNGPYRVLYDVKHLLDFKSKSLEQPKTYSNNRLLPKESVTTWENSNKTLLWEDGKKLLKLIVVLKDPLNTKKVIKEDYLQYPIEFRIKDLKVGKIELGLVAEGCGFISPISKKGDELNYTVEIQNTGNQMQYLSSCRVTLSYETGGKYVNYKIYDLSPEERSKLSSPGSRLKFTLEGISKKDYQKFDLWKIELSNLRVKFASSDPSDIELAKISKIQNYSLSISRLPKFSNPYKLGSNRPTEYLGWIRITYKNGNKHKDPPAETYLENTNEIYSNIASKGYHHVWYATDKFGKASNEITIDGAKGGNGDLRKLLSIAKDTINNASSKPLSPVAPENLISQAITEQQRVYPNPVAAGSQLTVSFGDKVETTQEIKLFWYSVQGALVGSSDQVLNPDLKGCSTIVPANLANGLYHLVINVNGKKRVYKVMVKE